MKVCKILLVVYLMHAISCLSAVAQTAIGKTTHLMHPSGIPATVTTNEKGTIANVDGRIVSKTEDTGLNAHAKAVKKLRWSGFQLQ